MNIYDIARKAGVSIATVSRVINDSAHVREATRQKVLSVIADANYTPNAFARNLSARSSRTVGVLCTDIYDNMYYTRAIAVLEQKLHQYGLDVLLWCTGRDLEDKKKAVNMLLSRKVDGLVLVGSDFTEQKDHSHIARAAANVPVMIINSLLELPGTYCLLCDEQAAEHGVVRALYRDGYRNIAFVYANEARSTQLKRAGYKRGIASCGLEVNPSWVLKAPNDIYRGATVIRKMLEAMPRPCAVVASGDLLACAALKAAAALGLRVPEDVAVVGCNNSLLCTCATPSLTSIDNMADGLCTRAIDMMQQLFGGEQCPQVVTLPARLVVRESYRPAHTK
nr:LacI family DNA-binding transcriptional regulator [Maliibacterium massiliense]